MQSLEKIKKLWQTTSDRTQYLCIRAHNETEMSQISRMRRLGGCSCKLLGRTTPVCESPQAAKASSSDCFAADVWRFSKKRVAGRLPAD